MTQEQAIELLQLTPWRRDHHNDLAYADWTAGYEFLSDQEVIVIEKNGSKLGRFDLTKKGGWFSSPKVDKNHPVLIAYKKAFERVVADEQTLINHQLNLFKTESEKNRIPC